jgi:hypothetical protein
MAFPSATNGAQNQSAKVLGFGPLGESEKLQYQGIYLSTDIGRFIITAEVSFNLVDT